MSLEPRSWPIAGSLAAVVIAGLLVASSARATENPAAAEADTDRQSQPLPTGAEQAREPGNEPAAPQDEQDQQEAAEQQALAEEAAEQQALAEQAAEQQALAEQAAEQQALSGLRSTVAFREVSSINAPAGSGRVLAFYPLADGGVVIATGAGQEYGEQTTPKEAVVSGPQQPPSNQLVWLDAEGNALRTAPLPFAAKGVTVAPDGSVAAVGADRIVAFAADGEKIADAESPHFRLTAEEEALLAEEIVEQHREQLESRRELLKEYVDAKAFLEAIPEEERTPRQKEELIQADRTLKVNGIGVSAEDVVKSGLAEARSIHRVAASRDHFFFVAREPTGHRYGVWRCGRDFSAPEKLIGGLLGCCGQMDVQVIGDELVIAENVRHQVVVLGLDGEPRRTFGKGSRTDLRAGFGGCCNPMNACCGPGGSLLLAESSGIVKQFTPDGTLIDILAVANVPPGCKNSSIGFSADGSTLYYLDIGKGCVLALEKKS